MTNTIQHQGEHANGCSTECKPAKLSFPCSCNGCRNYPTRPAEIWHESQIASKAQGYFFTKETMRFFNSRIADFRPVGISPSGVDSLMVIVSNKRDNDPRYYEIITLCPYGEIGREWARDNEGTLITQYASLVQARKSARWNCTIAPQLCECHGCQLDKAGR
jgi:hypothetical protein